MTFTMKLRLLYAWAVFGMWHWLQTRATAQLQQAALDVADLLLDERKS